MGPNESSSFSSSHHHRLNRNYFDFQYIIGKGGFGKVWRVIFKKNQKLYALKEMSKVKIIDRKSEKSIKCEREFLIKLHHPFIVNMSYSFQDYENLYLVMDLLTGGDLRFHICKYRMFSEEQTKFFIACVLLGLQYIHGNNIIHRDIKPENLVCDEKGYLRITDFGVAKVWHHDNSSETSGTPGYMAPEILCSQNHSYSVDFFALGVMAYEFMLGERPYQGKSRKEIKHAVLKKQAFISYNELPEGWAYESADFINHLLKRKDTKRLGHTNGVTELKEHKWYEGFDWNSLYTNTMQSPFTPSPNGNYDKKYCEEIDQLGSETIEKYQSIMKQTYFIHCFQNYTFINENEVPLLSSNKCANQLTSSVEQHKTMVTTNENDNTKLKTNQIDYQQSIPFPNANQNSNLNSNAVLNPISNVNFPGLRITPGISKFVIGSNKVPFQIRNDCNMNMNMNINPSMNININMQGSHNMLYELQRKDKMELFGNSTLKEQSIDLANHKRHFNNKMHLSLNGLPNFNRNYPVPSSHIGANVNKMESSSSCNLLPFQLPIINANLRESGQIAANKGKKSKLSIPIPLTGRKVNNSLRKSGSTGFVTNSFAKTRFTGEPTSNMLSPKNQFFHRIGKKPLYS